MGCSLSTGAEGKDGGRLLCPTAQLFLYGKGGEIPSTPPPWVPMRARGAQHVAPWLLAPEHGHRAEQEVPKSSSTIVH